MQIEVKDLTFRYDPDQPAVLSQVSFSIAEGSFVSIIGHNGSGKSTIARLLIGLLEKESGSIKIDGEELSVENLQEIRQKLAIVFQNPDNQFIGATVRDDIAFGLENRQVNPQDMEEIIHHFAKEVNMLDFLDQEPTKLSGGQKQRVALAGVLAMHPKILILDEASAMLDPKGKKEVFDLVHQLHQKYNMTIISITHDVESLLESDQIIVVNQGKILFDGKPEEILSEVDLLASISLEAPFSVQLAHMLNQQGISLENSLDERELVEKLCQYNSTK